MNAGTTARWPSTFEEALQEQKRLSRLVRIRDEIPLPVRRVAGVDVGFPGGGAMARAAVVVLEYPDLVPVDFAVAEIPVIFPYVPGFLSFREIPAILEAFAKLTLRAELVFCDGQGIAHPRGLGIASHLGLILDLPTIGVGKSKLVGTFSEPGVERGEGSPLLFQGRVIGTVLRTRRGVSPLFISPGHRVSLASATEWVLRVTGKYRLPETTRWAHKVASEGAVPLERSTPEGG